jgi:hypothetical protein
MRHEGAGQMRIEVHGIPPTHAQGAPPLGGIRMKLRV